MTRQTLQPPVKACLGIAALLIVSIALAGAPPESSSAAKKDKTAAETEKKADKQIRREAEQVVRSIDLEIYRDDKWTKVERIDKPLLFYGDPTRANDRGSVWGWGKKGRPIARNAYGSTRSGGWRTRNCIWSTTARKSSRRRAGTECPGRTGPIGSVSSPSLLMPNRKSRRDGPGITFGWQTAENTRIFKNLAKLLLPIKTKCLYYRRP